MDLEVALEPGLRRQAVGVQRHDRREVRAVVGDLLEDGVAAGVAEPVVLGVDAEQRRVDRVVHEQASDAGLDEVVEARVERPLVGRGLGSRQVDAAELVRSSVLRRPAGGRLVAGWVCPVVVIGASPDAQAALVAGSPAGLGAVSRSTSATAAITVSMSSAVIP